MKFRCILVSILINCIPITFAQAQTIQNLNVVVTIQPLAFFVEALTQGQVQVESLVHAGANPHTYEPKPSQIRKFEQADLFIYLGTGIDFEEMWMDKLLATNVNVRKIDLSEHVDLIPFEVDQTPHEDEDENVDSHEEHEHGHHRHSDLDPHIWLSLSNAQMILRTIYGELLQLLPESEKQITESFETLSRQIEAQHTETKKLLANLNNKIFLVSHPNWGYFCRDYKLRQISIEQHGKEPGIKDLMHIIDESKENNIRLIVSSRQFHSKSVDMIAKNLQATVVMIDPFDASYLQIFKLLTQELKKHNGK